MLEREAAGSVPRAGCVLPFFSLGASGEGHREQKQCGGEKLMERDSSMVGWLVDFKLAMRIKSRMVRKQK
jgi:hypothetical protein